MEQETENRLVKLSQDKAKESVRTFLPEMERCFRRGVFYGYDEAEKDFMAKAKKWFESNIPSKELQLMWVEFENFMCN